MKRVYKKRGIRSSYRRFVKFLSGNALILFMIILILIGVYLGVYSYRWLYESGREDMLAFISTQTISTDFLDACKLVCSTSLMFILLLMLLFLFGLTSFGCPIILLTMVGFGVWFGILQSKSYIDCGLLHMIICVELPMMLASFAMILAAKRSMQMSCMYTRQILPFSAHCGSLWGDFKIYLSTYVICVGVVFVASSITVLAKTISAVL